MSSANSNSSSPASSHALTQVAVVGVEQAELADVGHELGEEAPLEPGVGVDLERARGLEDARVDGLGGHAHALPDLGRGRAQPVPQRVLDQELLAVLELGLGQPLVVLGQAEHAERHVAGLVGHDVAQQLLQQRLLGVAQHRAEGGERQALDDDLHAEVGDVPPLVLEEGRDLVLEERAHRVRLAQLGVQVLGEHLGVAGLVHRLRRRVVLGVDPRHGLDDLGRGHHGALLAVHELAQLGLEALDAQRRQLLVAPVLDRRSVDLAGGRGELHERRALVDQTFGVDVGVPVELGDAVPLRAHGLVVERDELAAGPVVVPQEDAVRVVVDDLDRGVDLALVGQGGGRLGRRHLVSSGWRGSGVGSGSGPGSGRGRRRDRSHPARRSWRRCGRRAPARPRRRDRAGPSRGAAAGPG